MLTVICPHCHALHFDCEKLTSSRVNYPKFGMCCLQGQIQLPPFQPLTGALLPHGGQTPMYAQIYILDTAEQLNVRRANNHNLDPIVMDNLQTMLLDNYPYIGYYHHAYELIREKPVEEQEEITIRLHMNLQQDQRTHNLPTAKEIAVIIPEDGVHYALDNRDVVLQARGEQLEWISQNSPLYSALHYVLLFPKGENGWHLSQMVTYLICDLRKEFFKRVQARFR